MSAKFAQFNVTDTEKAIAVVADVEGDIAGTVVVLAETDDQGETAGQLSFKHGVPKGTTAGTWTTD